MRYSFTTKPFKTYMKLIVEIENDLVLGVHLICSEAPELIQMIAISFKIGVRKSDFDNTVAVHPTSAEELVLLRNHTRIL